MYSKHIPADAIVFAAFCILSAAASVKISMVNGAVQSEKVGVIC